MLFLSAGLKASSRWQLPRRPFDRIFDVNANACFILQNAISHLNVGASVILRSFARFTRFGASL